MTDRYNNKKVKLIINMTYIFYLAIIIYIALRYAFKLFFPFIPALLISVIAEPFVVTFTNKYRIKRGVASFICLFIFYAVILALIFLISAVMVDKISVIAENMDDFTANLTNYFNNFKQFIERTNSKILKELFDATTGYLQTITLSEIVTGSFGSKLIIPFTNLIRSLPSYFFSILIAIIASFFISSYLPEIKLFILNQASCESKTLILKSSRLLKKIIKEYLKSYILIVFLTFCELFILFTIFKIKPTLILALIISLVDILPILGVGTVLIPWSIISFVVGDTAKAVILLAIYALITVIRQIAEPRIVGKTIGMNPLVALISLYLGFKLFGLIGVVFMPISLMLLTELNNSNAIKIWNNKSIDNSKQ